MIGALVNHLWQSTLFALVAMLLTAMLRHNRASVRYCLWFAASFKFFVPFSLFINLGSHLRWMPVVSRIATVPPRVISSTIASPGSVVLPLASAGTRAAVDWVHVFLIGLWVCGFVAIVLIRLRSWRRIQAILRTSTPLPNPGIGCAVVQARSAPDLLEPGVVGLWRPVLLLPAGVVDSLTAPQLEAVLAHELCHVQRRDNLTASIHMIVEAVFWFHRWSGGSGRGWWKSASGLATNTCRGSSVSRKRTPKAF
jgi:beta-lactamase regulating signal transducer with metallopeptidase domain